MIGKIDATVVFVQDLDKCMKFYRDMLGLEITMTDPVSVVFRMEGQDFLLLKTSAAVEMINEGAVSPQGSGGVLLCVGVENVDATYHALTAKGLAFIKPPIDQVWGRRTTYFADPEGNLWELWQHLPSA